jgi:hypothetical protein
MPKANKLECLAYKIGDTKISMTAFSIVILSIIEQHYSTKSAKLCITIFSVIAFIMTVINVTLSVSKMTVMHNITKKLYTQYNDTQHERYSMPSNVILSGFVLNVTNKTIMLSVARLSVVKLSIMAPVTNISM